MQTNSLPRFSNVTKRFSWSLGIWQWSLFHISLDEGQLSRKDGNSSEKSEFQVFIQMMSETASLPSEYLLWIRQTLIFKHRNNAFHPNHDLDQSYSFAFAWFYLTESTDTYSRNLASFLPEYYFWGKESTHTGKKGQLSSLVLCSLHPGGYSDYL